MAVTHRIRRALHYINLMEDGLLIGMLALMIVLAATQIILRNLLGSGIAGSDQLLRLLVLWVGLLGAVAASRDEKQINIDMLSRFLPARARSGVRVVIDLFTAVVSAIVAWQAGRFVHSEYIAGSMAFLNLPAWVAELILPLGFGLMALRYLLFFFSHLRRLLRGDTGA
jgi:TRAP-type C4-dicarboxylate transport system permease small subunit